MMPNSRLFHYAVGDMTDAYLSVYGKISIGNRAVPYIVIPSSVTYKMTVIFEKNLPDFFLVLSH